MSADPEAGQNKEPSSTRLVLTLGVAGLLSGLLLVVSYEGTLPRITENKAAALQRSITGTKEEKGVVPGSAAIQKLVSQSGKLAVAHKDDKSAGIYAAYDQQKTFVGYAIVGEGPGFQDTITLIYGFDPKKQRIIGMAVLDSRETPGLGDKIYKDPEFRKNFFDLAVAPAVKAVKPGSKSAPNEIDAITGATISSKAVASIINEAHKQWIGLLPPHGNEPKLEDPPPSSGMAERGNTK
jgi:electron transport complex protein RnfG